MSENTSILLLLAIFLAQGCAHEPEPCPVPPAQSPAPTAAPAVEHVTVPIPLYRKATRAFSEWGQKYNSAAKDTVQAQLSSNYQQAMCQLHAEAQDVLVLYETGLAGFTDTEDGKSLRTTMLIEQQYAQVLAARTALECDGHYDQTHILASCMASVAAIQNDGNATSRAVRYSSSTLITAFLIISDADATDEGALGSIVELHQRLVLAKDLPVLVSRNNLLGSIMKCDATVIASASTDTESKSLLSQRKTICDE